MIAAVCRQFYLLYIMQKCNFKRLYLDQRFVMLKLREVICNTLRKHSFRLAHCRCDWMRLSMLCLYFTNRPNSPTNFSISTFSKSIYFSYCEGGKYNFTFSNGSLLKRIRPSVFPCREARQALSSGFVVSSKIIVF